VENRFWDIRPLLGPLTVQLNFTSRHPFSKPTKARQMEYGLESWWVYFVWCCGNSFHGVWMHYRRDPESGIKLFTLKLYTQRKILK
jgi:hypothetical protein